MAKSRKSLITEKGILEEDMRILMTPESLKELSEHLTPTVQQFLGRFIDYRDFMLGENMRKELKEFLTEIRKEETKQITDCVCLQMAEVLEPIVVKLGNIEAGIADIKTRLDELEKQIQIVEDEVKTEDERIRKLERTQIWWNIAFRIGIAVAISAAISLIIHFNL